MGILDDVTSLLGNIGGQAGGQVAGVLGAVQALITEQGGLQVGRIEMLQAQHEHAARHDMLHRVGVAGDGEQYPAAGP